jgi:hypothetical protein
MFLAVVIVEGEKCERIGEAVGNKEIIMHRGM